MSNNGGSNNSTLLDRLIREEGFPRMCVPFSRVIGDDLDEFSRLVREGYLAAVQPFGFWYEVTDKGAYGKLGAKMFNLAKEYYPNLRAATQVARTDDVHAALGGVWQIDLVTGQRYHTVLVRWQELVATYPDGFGEYRYDVARWCMGYDDKHDILFMSDKTIRRA